MDAATLTAIRARNNEGPDGDRVFVLGCQLGRNGTAAQHAYQVAVQETALDGSVHTAQADTTIADRIIGLINSADASTLDDEGAVFLQFHQFGKRAWDKGAGDREYIMWLYAAGSQFQDLCGYYPLDLDDPMWRASYDAGQRPDTAARLALHYKPLVNVDTVKQQLACPVCLTPDRIAEHVVQRVGRKLLVDDDGIYASGSLDTVDLSRQAVCRECGAELRLPEPAREDQ